MSSQYFWAFGVLPFVVFLSSSSAETRTAVFRNQTLTYEVVDGRAVFEGDILLGDPDANSSKIKTNEATSITGDNHRWPGGVIPYTIDSGLNIKAQIDQAIQHWNTNTPIRLVPRGSEQNYVRFVPNPNPNAPVCSSYVGMNGGPQDIVLVDGCSVGAIIHEIGHAVGLWHEQSRKDRNASVTVLFDNVQSQYAYNFDQHVVDGVDLGPYSFGSIMHYTATEFTKIGLPTIETVPTGIPIGQRSALSPGDIDAVMRMYGVAPQGITISTYPTGLQFVVDGTVYTTPQVFSWPDGSTHTVGVVEIQGSGYVRSMFAAWSDGGVAQHTITAGPGLTVLTANFRQQYRVTAMAGTGGTVRMSPQSPDGYYDLRTAVEFTAVPDPGYQFLAWSQSVQGSQNPKILTVYSSAVASAQFSQALLTTITTDPVGLTITVDGLSYNSPRNFEWKSGSHTIAVSTASSDPDVKYWFKNWSNGGSQTQTIQVSGTAATYTATVGASYRLNTGVTPGSGGSVGVSPISSDGFYEANAEVSLSARPSSGYTFQSWGGDLFGGGLTRSITMNGPKTASAGFTRQTQPFAVVNAASYDSGSISPGQIVTVFGTGIGPSIPVGLQVSGDTVTSSLEGTRILFDGIPAPLTYVSDTQVSAVVPYAIAGRTTIIVTPERNGVPMTGLRFGVGPCSPGIFTLDASGRGSAAVLNQDSSVNTPSNPAPRNSVVSIYATGAGMLKPDPVDGKLASPPYAAPQAPVSVRIGGRPAEIQYAGSAPGFVSGVLQINVKVPEGIVPGPAVPVALVIGSDASASGVTIAVR